MASFTPNGIDCIVEIKVTTNAYVKAIVIEADGRVVYRGDDLEVAKRWLDYWRNHTPWNEILETEDV